MFIDEDSISLSKVHKWVIQMGEFTIFGKWLQNSCSIKSLATITIRGRRWKSWKVDIKRQEKQHENITFSAFLTLWILLLPFASSFSIFLKLACILLSFLFSLYFYFSYSCDIANIVNYPLLKCLYEIGSYDGKRPFQKPSDYSRIRAAISR